MLNKHLNMLSEPEIGKPGGFKGFSNQNDQFLMDSI